MKHVHTNNGLKGDNYEVKLYCDDDKKGWVTLGLETAKEKIQLYITKTGKVRVSGQGGAWTPPAVPYLRNPSPGHSAITQTSKGA